jgi:hypothetical protein
MSRRRGRSFDISSRTASGPSKSRPGSIRPKTYFSPPLGSRAGGSSFARRRLTRWRSSPVVGEPPRGAVDQSMGVEMVFRHIDANGIVVHLFRASACHSGSPPGIRSGQRKRRGRSNSSSTRQTVSVLPIRPSPLREGSHLLSAVPSRLLGAKSHKTSVLLLG